MATDEETWPTYTGNFSALEKNKVVICKKKNDSMEMIILSKLSQS